MLPLSLNKPSGRSSANSRILNYSNPDIAFAGLATGVAGTYDNARETRASMCDVANDQPPPAVVVNIVGGTNLCSPTTGEVINPTHTIGITPPVAGFPGQAPYTVKWFWSADGIFNPGTFLGSGNSVTVGRLLVPIFSCGPWCGRATVTPILGRGA